VLAAISNGCFWPLNTKGFPTRNLKYMQHFTKHCSDGQFGQQHAAQLWAYYVSLGFILGSMQRRTGVERHRD